MDLSELHDEFEFLSGRTDLSDARKSFFINSGQRYLDRLDTIKHSIGKVIRTVNIGDWYLTFQECRAIEKVYVSSDTARWELDKKALDWLMLEYPEPIADIDSGDPLYYATPILRSVPQDLTSITLSKFVGEVVQVDHEHFGYSGIVWMPPSDVTLVVEVQGLFYTEKLANDEDQSSWSASYPDLLLMASFRALEIFHRNTEGVKDWTNAIAAEVITLGMDFIEEDVAGVNQMEDSTW